MATLKRIDAISVPVIENSLGIFDILPTSVAFNRTHVRELLPLTTVTRDGPYTFRLFSDSQFIDFSKTWFYLKSSIEKKVDNEWVEIGDTDDDQHTGVIQNYGQSFIKQLKISVNGTDIFNSGATYSYRSYIANEFGMPMNVRRGLHEIGGYFPDGELGQANANGYGFRKRSKMFSNGKKASTMVLLNFDLANQNNLFINNTDIIFTIWPHKDDFLLLTPIYMKEEAEPELVQQQAQIAQPTIAEVEARDAEIQRTRALAAAAGATPATSKIRMKRADQAVTNNTTYRIRVHEVKMYVTLVDIVQTLQNEIAKQLESTPAKYPLRKLEMRHIYLPEGTTNVAWNVFTSVIPRRIMVFMVKNKSYDGDPETSPFYFEHSMISTISVEANNMIVPDNPYRFDFTKLDGNYARAFIDFYEGLDHINQEKAIELSLQKYVEGWTTFVFPLSSSHRDVGDSFELIKNGATVIKANFDTPIEPGGTMLLALGEFDEVLTINSDRVLSVDGSV